MEAIETNLKEKNILFYKLDLSISLIFQLTKAKNKFILPKVAKRDQFLGFFPNYTAHQENNNEENFITELDPTKPRDKETWKLRITIYSNSPFLLFPSLFF